MSYCALWLDNQNAYIYTFTADGVDEKKLKAHSDENDKFFHEIASSLSGAEELMIMGPGVAKDRFKHHCENHKHAHLVKAIVGVKTMESHPTKAMMLEKAHEFFDSYHKWTKNY
jgi:stalled ribosome rescue protein Dom34